MLDEAKQWEGWGTALKPALEPIVLARKPLSEGTVAANVLRWRTGALNIGASRIQASAADVKAAAVPNRNNLKMFIGEGEGRGEGIYDMSQGRWPANIALDGSKEATAYFPVDGNGESAARYFYSAKADDDDRIGSKHPTVKPVDLMQWLVRLITPKGGLVLDPFAGTGTTAEACYREGMRCMLVERENEYQGDIRRRMALCVAGPEERSRESIKAKKLPVDHGPLFGGQPTLEGGQNDLRRPSNRQIGPTGLKW